MELLVTAIFPVFALMGLGAFAQYYKILGPGVATGLNQFVYYFALPAFMFTAMASAPIHKLLYPGFIIIFFVGALATFAVGFILVRVFFKNILSINAMQSLGSSFSNTGFIGIPFLLLLLGPKAVLPGAIATMIVVFLIAIALFVIEIDKDSATKVSALIKRSSFLLLKNPLIVAPSIGIIWSATGLGLPKPICVLGHLLGQTAGPCALFAVGKALAAYPFSFKFKEVITIVLLKMCLLCCSEAIA